MDALGVFYHYGGAYVEAERLLQNAMAIHKELLGSDHYSTAFHVCFRSFIIREFNQSLCQDFHGGYCERVIFPQFVC